MIITEGQIAIDPLAQKDKTMSDEQIAEIAEIAGVSFEVAQDWIAGDWTESSTPASAEEHAAWIEGASNKEIAGWIAAGQ